MLGDGKTPYDFGNDGDATSIGGCSANFRRTNVATKLKITYVKDVFLDVKVQYKAWDEWSDCFRVDKISLPASPYLGFSAMTGDVYDAHDIITVTTNSIIPSQPGAARDKMSTKTGFNTGGTWLGLLVKLSLVAGVCVGAWYAWKQYALNHGYDVNSPFARWGGGGLDGLYANGKRF